MTVVTEQQKAVYNQQLDIFDLFLKRVRGFSTQAYLLSHMTKTEEPDLYYVRLAADSPKFMTIWFDKSDTNFRVQTIEVSLEAADEKEAYYRRYDLNGNLAAHNKQTLYFETTSDPARFKLVKVYHRGVSDAPIESVEMSMRDVVLMALEAFGDEPPLLATRVGSNSAN